MEREWPHPLGCFDAFRAYQVTSPLLALASPDVVLNPCPPFSRGREVSAEVIAGPRFVGYQFKRSLLAVQQAVLVFLQQVR
ncbi:MAG: hypothetical protein LBI99_09620 [Propionibacteriaceae bacterium]|jgi:ornithine carbamoyltransferase|nr:hypothetical protein [Propionibacteriaceae bacterium]